MTPTENAQQLLDTASDALTATTTRPVTVRHPRLSAGQRDLLALLDVDGAATCVDAVYAHALTRQGLATSSCRRMGKAWPVVDLTVTASGRAAAAQLRAGAR